MAKTRKMLDMLKNLLSNEQGQTLVEYGLILILIAIVVLVMLTGTGQKVNNTYTLINSTIPSP